jgi:hypothetical protein
VAEPSPQVTIIDVLENALDGELSAGAIEQLSLTQISELAEPVQDFYEVWAPPALAEGDFRIHLGGWVAGNTQHEGARDLLHAGLLYAHQILIHDPVAAYFEPRRKIIKACRRLGMSAECWFKARRATSSRPEAG